MFSGSGMCARMWTTPPGGKGSGRGGAKKGAQQHVCTKKKTHIAAGTGHFCDGCGATRPLDEQDLK